MIQITSESGEAGHGAAGGRSRGSAAGVELSLEDLSAVRRSLPLVQARRAALGARLLANLRALVPGLRQRPGKGLVSALMHTLARLDDRKALDVGAAEIARWGLRDEHVRALGYAFIVALGETLGPEFTLQHLDAWRAAYDHLSEWMVARA